MRSCPNGGINRFAKTVIYGAVAWLALQTPASANAGTPLLWVAVFHLFIGNALLGIAEGYVLGRLLRVPIAKAMTVMMAANYFSAWVGSLLLRKIVWESPQVDLNNGWIWFWALAFGAYLLTILLEWPFVAWLLRGRVDWLRRSISSSSLIQTISYSLLLGCYWLAGDTSLYTRTSIVRPAEMSLPEAVLVYYISVENGHAYQRPLKGGTAKAVGKLSAHHANDRLFVRQSASDSARWDLMAWFWPPPGEKPKIVELLSDLDVEAALDARQERGSLTAGSWMNFGNAARLGTSNDSAWEFSTGFWAVEGLKARNRETAQKVTIAFETTFMEWHPRNAVHLAGDIVLFQLGRDQICVFDAEKNTAALLWRGKGPVAVIPRSGHPMGKSGIDAIRARLLRR